MKAGMRVKRVKRNGKLNRKGMTLVEVIVAMAILAIVLAPALRIFASTSGTNLRSRLRQRATSVAEGIMESFKAYNVEQLCRQFSAGNFKGVVGSTDTARPTTMSAKAVYGSVERDPLRTDGTLRDDADRYKFNVQNAVSEGQYYDVEILVTPRVATDVLKMYDANAYSDGIIALKEQSGYDALGALKTRAETTFETNFSSYHSSASGHAVDSVDITDFKRVIDLDVDDDGTVQTVVMKVTYTCKAKVNYHYSDGTGSHTSSKDYTETDMKLEEVLDTTPGAANPTQLKIYDNTSTIAGVELSGKRSKLNQLYLYYFPVYEDKYGSGAKDVINIDCSLTNLYNPGIVADPKAQGYEPLKITVAKQQATTLTEAELNHGEVNYNVSLNGTVAGGGQTELLTNLDENLAPLGSVIAPPSISGFSSCETVKDGIVDRVVLLYDVEIHVFEAGTTDEVASFVGTMNE